MARQPMVMQQMVNIQMEMQVDTVPMAMLQTPIVRMGALPMGKRQSSMQPMGTLMGTMPPAKALCRSWCRLATAMAERYLAAAS